MQSVLRVCAMTGKKSSRHGGILALPTPTRIPQSIEVVFVEASKLKWYWNPTLSR